VEKDYYFKQIPRSRIATFDTFAAGLLRHHVSALLQFDVTESRRILRDIRKKGVMISFNGWLVKVISSVLEHHPEASAFLYNKHKLIVFNDINISVLIEKKINGQKVPIPYIIKKTNHKSAQEISAELDDAKNRKITPADITLHKRASFSERMYYHLPGLLRRSFWRILLRNPRIAFNKMGNAVITSVGTIGVLDGWFIHRSVHPISFGIGSILKKPMVVENEIQVREILHITVLIDHDVIDGAPMVRLLNALTRSIESGYFLEKPNPQNTHPHLQ